MPSRPAQNQLFDIASDEVHGLVYEAHFLTVCEERALVEDIERLPFAPAQFQQYTARREVVRFGEGDYPASYGRLAQTANPRHPLPDFLVALRRRVASWRAIDESRFAHALVTRYRPGTPIGWHSDAPHFEVVVGISLLGAAQMRFRPYAAKEGRNAVFELELAPRSAYVMQGDIRWRWQHHIPPTKELRYSITLRTLRT